VQFSARSAPLRTALVATILFAVLSLEEPGIARLFADMVERGPEIASALPPALQARPRHVAAAFRAAFLACAAFTMLGFFLALSIPLRRI